MSKFTDFFERTFRDDGSGHRVTNGNLAKRFSMFAAGIVPAVGAFAVDNPGNNIASAADAAFAGQQNAVVLDYVPDDGGGDPPKKGQSPFDMSLSVTDAVNAMGNQSEPKTPAQEAPAPGISSTEPAHAHSANQSGLKTLMDSFGLDSEGTKSIPKAPQDGNITIGFMNPAQHTIGEISGMDSNNNGKLESGEVQHVKMTNGVQSITIDRLEETGSGRNLPGDFQARIVDKGAQLDLPSSHSRGMGFEGVTDYLDAAVDDLNSPIMETFAKEMPGLFGDKQTPQDHFSHDHDGAGLSHKSKFFHANGNTTHIGVTGQDINNDGVLQGREVTGLAVIRINANGENFNADVVGDTFEGERMGYDVSIKNPMGSSGSSGVNTPHEAIDKIGKSLGVDEGTSKPSPAKSFPRPGG